ncbi:uncharacterized protein LOC142635332 [Castanea sativa]|uniref:uncharacterized protein LOC142635332 n=1 Tax=Castanea sativa TaxID=21020 RepID=UPI003F64F145
MFAITSVGGKVDRTEPKSAQLYIFDTENEVQHRIRSISSDKENDGIDPEIVNSLIHMLDDNNALVKVFRIARDHYTECNTTDVRLRLTNCRTNHSSQYNLPTASKVAGLIVGDFDPNNGYHGIIVEDCDHGLWHISEIHPTFMAMQYPLLFPYGEDGFSLGIPKRLRGSMHETENSAVTMKEYYAFRIRQRLSEGGYKKKLDYLRAEIYSSLKDAVLQGDTTRASIGKRIVLPSSFTGGPRYMIQNYQDAMAICRWAGYPNLFLTFTCNPKWLEIISFLELIPGQKSKDRPDILARAFKVKLDALLQDIKKGQHFGKVVAVVYTIEFQKRGLPHAHILVFLHPDDKYSVPKDIDSIISAEIPDSLEDSIGHEVVKQSMMHGPCGATRPNSPCMVDNSCTKHFPKHLFVKPSLMTKAFRLIEDEKLLEQIWELNWKDFSEDILFRQSYALYEIEKLLIKAGKSLKDYPAMPLPNMSLIRERNNRLLEEEMSYDKEALAAEYALSSVASLGIASLLLPGGCTAHSRFHIPLCVNEDSMCDIKQKTQLAKLLCATKLIIWDEAPMARRNCFEALDRTLRDILHFSSNFDPNKVFGGIIVIFGGDFRQILLVIPKGRREDIVASAINKSVIWNHCEIFMLTENMRLNQIFNDWEDSQSIVDFGNWILRIENGEFENVDGESWIEIPEDLIIKPTRDPSDIINVTYLDMHDKMKGSQYLQERAILAPTNEIVNKINDQILSLVDEEELVYLRSDTVYKSSNSITNLDMLYLVEFLNSLEFPGIPKHKLKLKVGIPIMLLRNLNQIAASKWPFILKRRQFPISVSFAMIINKSQGQSLNRLSDITMSKGYSFLDQISNAKETWRLRVRICKMWKAVNKRSRNNFINLDMIFIDENANIIGKLTTVGPIEQVHFDNSSTNIRNLEILLPQDKELKISSWDESAETITKNDFKEDEGPYVIIVTSTTVKAFQGKLNLNTTSASKVYVNLDITEVSELIDKYKVVEDEYDNVVRSIPTHDKKSKPESELILQTTTSLAKIKALQWVEGVKNQEQNKVPQEIQNLLGKSYTFQIKVDDYNVKEGWEVYTVTSVFKSESNKHSGNVVADNIQIKQLETPFGHGQTIANGPIGTSDIKLLTSLKDVTNDNIIEDVFGNTELYLAINPATPVGMTAALVPPATMVSASPFLM